MLLLLKLRHLSQLLYFAGFSVAVLAPLLLASALEAASGLWKQPSKGGHQGVVSGSQGGQRRGRVVSALTPGRAAVVAVVAMAATALCALVGKK